MALEMGRHHVRIHGLVERRRAIAFLLIIVIAPVEVRRALVFGGAAVVCVSCNKLPHVTG